MDEVIGEMHRRCCSYRAWRIWLVFWGRIGFRWRIGWEKRESGCEKRRKRETSKLLMEQWLRLIVNVRVCAYMECLSVIPFGYSEISSHSSIFRLEEKDNAGSHNRWALVPMLRLAPFDTG